jgi:hypothetical protein
MVIVSRTGPQLTDDHGTTLVTRETDRRLALRQNKATLPVHTLLTYGDLGNGKRKVTVRETVDIQCAV